MEKQITLVFHNKGLRSYIEVDLCAQCPRQDGKGCCGHYSPVFYPTDLAYLCLNHPDLIELIFSFKDSTVLDASITINNDKDGDSYRCKFHSLDGGCLLAQTQRETICRHFVCPGINWVIEEKLQPWKIFFERLFEYEIQLNNHLALELAARGLTLRHPQQRDKFLQELVCLYHQEIVSPPEFFQHCPSMETATITRSIAEGKPWPL